MFAERRTPLLFRQLLCGSHHFSKVLAFAFSLSAEIERSMISIPITEGAAYTIGTERFEGKVGGEQMRGEWRATNIYRREDGAWKIVHHHTDASPGLQDLLRRLQTQAGQATG